MSISSGNIQSSFTLFPGANLSIDVVRSMARLSNSLSYPDLTIPSILTLNSSCRLLNSLLLASVFLTRISIRSAITVPFES